MTTLLSHIINRRSLIVSLLLGLTLELSLSQPANDLPFEHLTTQQGLSQNIVTAIAQDSRGFLWIGTEDGLSRYDGVRMETYRHSFSDPNSLSDNWVRDLLLDSDGVLWVATHSGLNRYNPELDNFTQFHHIPGASEQEQVLPSDYLFTLCEYNGDIWIGTGGEGLARFDKQTLKAKQYRHNPKDHKLPANLKRSLPNDEVKSLFVDESNTLWIGTADGLCRYDSRLDSFVTYKKGLELPSGERGNYEVRDIFEDSNGTLWIGVGQVGLNYFSPNRVSILNFEEDKDAPELLSQASINTIFEDDTEALWVGTTQGLLRREKGSKKFEIIKNTATNPKSLNNNDVSCFYEDASRMLWVGTRGGGVNVYDVHRKGFVNYNHDYQNPNSLNKDVVRAIYEDGKGILWVGLREGGMDRIDRKKHEFVHFESDRKNPNALWGGTVSAIYQDSRGLLWVGSWGDGLNCYNPKTGTFKHYLNNASPNSLTDDRIQSIAEDRNGDLWIATDGGFNHWNRKTESFTRYEHDPQNPNSLSANTVQGQAFLFDKEGYLWIGTYKGTVDRFNPKTGEFKHFTPEQHGLPSNGVISLCSQNDVLWVGTDGGGLYRLNKYSELVKAYTIADGLSNNVIYSIKEDKNGTLWMSTKNGLSNFIPADKKFKNYYDYNGIQSNVFYWGAGFVNKKGEMFFGGINGLTIFSPSKIEENPFIPPVYITEFKLNNKPVKIGEQNDGRTLLEKDISLTKKLELDHNDRFFSFQFAALNYSHPERNSYQYKMEGFDENWRMADSKNPIAPYTNLPPGTYIFKVKGSNNDGLWNTTPTNIKVVMTPPWWNTWWAKTIGILLLAAFVYTYYVTRLRRLQRQKIALVEQVRLRTAEITEKNNALEEQQERIVKQNQRIQSSINYARRIQKSMMPVKAELQEGFSEYFIMLEPRNVVSGDFFWMTVKENKVFIAAVDCTGHGVPGAFMSMVGLDLLKETVNMRGILDPGTILYEMHKGIRKALHQDENQSRDGMDLALCSFERLENGHVNMEFAGAHNPVVYVQDREMHTIKGDRIGIGGYSNKGRKREFTTHKLLIDRKTEVYLFSDGYQDQFGGEKGRKLMSKNFKRLLYRVHDLPMQEQHETLLEELKKWKGNYGQTDDVLVVGVRLRPSS